MIAVDTNILVYAHRRDSEWHHRAQKTIVGLAEAATPWAIPWPCIHEFLAIVTHARIYKSPTPLDAALQQLHFWSESPSLRLIGELRGHLKVLEGILSGGKVSGGGVHDARIAAICREHGISELWTADRDFGRIPGVRVRNPLLQPEPPGSPQ
jgi:toxin-antitoxin system PIN domain toxin